MKSMPIPAMTPASMDMLEFRLGPIKAAPSIQNSEPEFRCLEITECVLGTIMLH